MSFLKAVLIAQIVLVFGMANGSNAMLIKTGVRLLTWPLELPFRILNFFAKIFVNVVRTALHCLAHLLEAALNSHRAARSLPEPAEIEAVAAERKLGLFGPKGLLSNAANYAV